jgi:hypothetical protein
MMKKTEAALELKQLIITRESELELERRALIDQFHITYESIKPLNMIRDTFKEVVSSPEIKTGAANTVIGLIAGHAAKKLFLRNSDNPIKKLLGEVLERVVANKTIKNAEDIKSVTGLLIKTITGPGNIK